MKKEEKAENHQEQPCPQCGYCPTCGRGPVVIQTYPIYVRPYYPTWGTISIGAAGGGGSGASTVRYPNTAGS